MTPCGHDYWVGGPPKVSVGCWFHFWADIQGKVQCLRFEVSGLGPLGNSGLQPRTLGAPGFRGSGLRFPLSGSKC